MQNVEQGIRAGEWLTIIAALIGPILAVQAQKWVERSRAKSAMKERIFLVLMATRGARISPEHVQALNTIPIAFYGSRLAGIRNQSKAEKLVTTRWRTYFDNLNQPAVGPDHQPFEGLLRERNEKFVSLLAAIAAEQAFDFDEVELLRSGYTPVHHETIDAESNAIRSGIARVLAHEAAIPMYVVNLPAQQQPPPPPLPAGPD